MKKGDGKLREQLQERVAELQSEFDRGNQRLKELDSEADKLRETLLRIAGGIQVLSEELKREESAEEREAVAA
jgi:predicted nuclease with TOPRIM domain